MANPTTELGYKIQLIKHNKWLICFDDGRELTIKQLAAIANVAPSTMVSRISRSETAQQLVRPNQILEAQNLKAQPCDYEVVYVPVDGKSKHAVLTQGKLYLVSDLAKLLNVYEGTLKHRLKNGVCFAALTSISIKRNRPAPDLSSIARSNTGHLPTRSDADQAIRLDFDTSTIKSPLHQLPTRSQIMASLGGEV